MDRNDIRLAEQRLLVDESGAGSAGLLLGQVLAPGDHLHPEGETDARNFSSDVAQSDDAKALASQVRAEAHLPSSRLERSGFPIDASHARQDQRPSELDGRSGIVARRGDSDAEIGRGLAVDGGVSRSCRSYQLQVRQLLQNLPCKRRAFAHDAYHIERPQPLDDCRGIGNVVVEHSDLRVAPDARPVGKPQRDVLVVVEDRNLHWVSSRQRSAAKNSARAPATALGSFSIGMWPADLIRTSLVSGISRA